MLSSAGFSFRSAGASLLRGGLLLAIYGCAQRQGPAVSERQPAHSPTTVASGEGPHGAPDYAWQRETVSPQFVDPPAELRNLAKRCQRFEASLMRSAQQVAQRQAAGFGAISTDELKFSLRSSGVPHAWHRTWSLEGTAIEARDAAQRLEPWLEQAKGEGELRCGIAQAAGDRGNQVLAIVAVDAVGELASLPTRARLGQWLTVNATLTLPARDAKVVVLGPDQAPRPVPTSLRDGRVRAAVSLDRQGPWLIQVLSVHETGPRPALEAMVFVDEDPATTFVGQVVPGEGASRGAKDFSAALLSMANGARAEAGVPPLARHAALDKLALDHARAMKKARLLAHDLGTGGPQERIVAAGLSVSASAENLARAKDAVAAHRALWASPAHRSTTLDRRFSAVGVGVVEDDDRSIWVCELYANFANAGKIPRTR